MVSDELGPRGPRRASALAAAVVTLVVAASAAGHDAEGAAGAAPSRTQPPIVRTEEQAARPATPPDKERAKLLYEQGVAAYQEQRYGDALDALLASADAYPSPLLYFNVSLVYEAMGDTASALAWLRRYLREAGATPDADAERRLTQLEARLQGDGVQQISVFSDPDGGLVDIDGRRIGVAPVTTQLIPGRHQVTITLPGYRAAKGTIDLRADKSMDVRLGLSPDGGAVPLAPPALPATQARQDTPPSSATPLEHGHRVSTWAIVSLSAGAAALGASLVFEIRRADAEAEARRASQVDYVAHVHEMETDQTLSRVFLGVGAALTIAGGIKLGFDLSDGGGSHGRAGVSSCGRAGVCGTAQGEFW